MNNVSSLHMDAVQGSFEAQSETYIKYVERALEKLTQQCAINLGRVSGSARKHAEVMQ